MISSISGYSFTPSDLAVGRRLPGVSAFMRIRNGADFLEATIRSHVAFFDEIVAVYNASTDGTGDILARLAAEFGPKIRVFHYEDKVYPPGSSDHARTDPASPNSMVNYSNFALAQTTRRIVTKLDDDHLAIPDAVAFMVERVRAEPEGAMTMHSFSGLNLMRAADGSLGIPALDPISGSGDIGFFPVTPDTVFTHDRRFERVPRQGLTRRFAGFAYWHLKYLKTGMGFGNYELERYPDSRFAARRSAMTADDRPMLTLPELVARKAPGIADKLAALVSQKRCLLLDRNAALVEMFGGRSLDAALAQMSDPAMLKLVLGGARSA
jgi:hypothetical protein